MKGCIDLAFADLSESIHDTTKAFGVARRCEKANQMPEQLLGNGWDGRSVPAVKGGTKDDPYGQGNPFGMSEMARKGGDQLH